MGELMRVRVWGGDGGEIWMDGGGVGDRYGDRRLLNGMYILIAPTY